MHPRFRSSAFGVHPTFYSSKFRMRPGFWSLKLRASPTFCSLPFRVHPVFWSISIKVHPTVCCLHSGWNLVFWCLTFRVHPIFCSWTFRMHSSFWSLKFKVHPGFCSLTFRQDAPCIQFYNIESAPLICLNIQGASSIEHVLGHKGGARAPSAPWLDPPLGDVTRVSVMPRKVTMKIGEADNWCPGCRDKNRWKKGKNSCSFSSISSTL